MDPETAECGIGVAVIGGHGVRDAQVVRAALAGELCDALG
jgi:hypothetical protein